MIHFLQQIQPVTTLRLVLHVHHVGIKKIVNYGLHQHESIKGMPVTFFLYTRNELLPNLIPFIVEI